MSDLLEEVDEIGMIFDRLSDIAIMLYKNDTNKAYLEFKSIMPKINSHMLKLLSRLPRFALEGIELPQDVILVQLENMVEAFEHRDTLMLADTIEYELNNTFSVYLEIIREFIKADLKI